MFKFKLTFRYLDNRAEAFGRIIIEASCEGMARVMGNSIAVASDRLIYLAEVEAL